MSIEECERELGPRGHLKVTKDNRPMVKKWLVANGFPSLFVGGLSYPELQLAYNETNGRMLSKLREKLARAQDEGDGDDPGVSYAPVTASQPLHAPAAPAPSVTIPQTAGGIEAAIRELIAATATKMDPDQVRAIVREELTGVAPQRIVVESPAGVIPTDGRVHPIFERLLRLAHQNVNVLIVGPAGCGKTHVCHQVAHALGRRFGMISGSAGASESMLTGWLLPGDQGRFEYRPSEFVECYEAGKSLFLLDEFDAFDANMLLTANAALANGHMYIPHRTGNPCVTRGTDTAIFATANTFGTGGDPVYVGRNGLDGATTDRFIILEMDYDEALEREIAAANGLSDDTLEMFWRFRGKVRGAKLRRVVSTRGLQKIAALARTGMSERRALEALTVGWSLDERTRAGVA